MQINRYCGIAPTLAPSAGTTLGSVPNSLLIAPGNYTLLPAGHFDFTQPGLYKIWEPVTVSGGNAANTYNRIVMGNDAYALASAVAHLRSFGAGDNALSLAQKSAKAMNSKLHMGCGPTGQYLKYLATACSIPVRSVHLLTAETPNGYNDGHEIVEMKVGGAWKAFDASLGFVFRDWSSGALLNIVEAITAIQNGTVVFERIAPFAYSSEAVSVHEFDEATWIEANELFTDAGMQAGIRRLYQIPFIYHNGVITGFLPAGTESRASWVTGTVGYQLQTEAAFMAQFY